MSTSHIRHDSDRAFLDQGGRFDESGGNKVISFIERFLCLEDGRPFKVLPWQQDVIHSWYSWFEASGQRRVTRGVLTCGRKQAKSILTFGLSAYHLIADGVEAPRVATCAVNREQAAQIFDWFAIAIDRNHQLRKALHPVASKKIIEYPKKHGRYRALSSDSKGGNLGHGYSFLAFDEMAFFSRNDELYHLLKNSTDARRGMQVMLSTAGFNKNCAFYREVQNCRKILSGEVRDFQTQPWIFEVPDGREDDESAWRLGCPSLGVTQSVEDFRQQWEREKRDATTRHVFQVLKMNQQKDQENVWLNVEDWDQCKTSLPVLDGKECVLGCDVGASRDLTSIAAVFPLEGKRYAVKVWNFVPEGALTTRDGANTVLYQSFAKSGSLTVTKGTATDEKQIISFLDTLRQRFKVRAVVFDKWQSLVIANHCKSQGLETYNFPQTHTYFNPAVIELERLVNRKQLLHDGDPCLRWQIGHTYLDTDNKGYKKPTTSRPENKKDSLIALLMALSQALQQPESKPSVYERRKIMLVG